MVKCLELAKKGTGLVSPNPLVGSVIVKNESIIAQGYHHFHGGDHAEADAISHCKSDLKNSILYCNLEPCCHNKKLTAPCCDLIIKKKIQKVVIGCLDPNPLVSGKGVAKLESAGIEVVSGILKDDCEQLNQVFFKFIQTKIPYIHLKMATTLDGKIAEYNGSSKWISNNECRKEVHQLRLRYDAIAVGIKTALLDNPKLNIRMKIDSKGKIPYKVIFGFKKELFDLNIYKQNPKKLLIITKEIGEDSRQRLISKGAQVIQLESLEDILFQIGKSGITSLLVEGGAKLFSSFIKNNLYDKISIYSAPIFKPKGISLINSECFEENFEIKNANFKIIGNNILTKGVNHVYRSC